MDGAANSFDVLDYVQRHITPFLLSAWLVAAALLNPEITERNIFASAVPYLFLLFFFAWLSLTLAWAIIYLGIQRKWLKFFKDKIFELVRWTWIELKAIGHFYIVKVVLGILIAIVGILVPQWLYYHFDIWHMLRTLKEFVMSVWRALFNIPDLIVAIHEWVNKTFLNWMVAILRPILKYAQIFVREDPVGGLALILGLIVVTILLILLVKNLDLIWKYFQQQEPLRDIDRSDSPPIGSPRAKSKNKSSAVVN